MRLMADGIHIPAPPLGLVKWMTLSSLKMLTSSMPGMVLTLRRFRVFCSRLSSVEFVLWTAFFFLHTQRQNTPAQFRNTQNPKLTRRETAAVRRETGAYVPPHGPLAAGPNRRSHLQQLIAVHSALLSNKPKSWSDEAGGIPLARRRRTNSRNKGTLTGPLSLHKAASNAKGTLEGKEAERGPPRWERGTWPYKK